MANNDNKFYVQISVDGETVKQMALTPFYKYYLLKYISVT